MNVTNKRYAQAIRSAATRTTPMTLPRGKRAISPLIATVLLLAFAVAIGTMVVNYISANLKVDPCADVGIGIEGDVCATHDGVTFVVTNTGSKALVNLKVRLVNENTKDVTEPQLANNLDPASAAKINFPYATISPESVSLTLTPVVNGKDGPLYCSEKSVRTTLQTC